MALARLVKVEKLSDLKQQCHVPLCDLLSDLVERNINGPDASTFSQIAHSLAHDLLNLATLAGRLLWYEGVTPDMSRSPDLVAIAVDTENISDLVKDGLRYFGGRLCAFLHRAEQKKSSSE